MRRLGAAAGVPLLLAGCAGLGPDGATSSVPGLPSATFSPDGGPRTATTRAEVVDIVDGDTIRVEIDGVRYAVRYIGINAPETREPGAGAAKQANRLLVAGTSVLLESDVSDRDRFDRLLRYVWAERDGQLVLVNRELVRMGLAISRAYPPDTAYQRLLDNAERSARRAKIGIWRDAGAAAVNAAPWSMSGKRPVIAG